MLKQIWPFRPSRAHADAERLLAAITQISRQPSFFGEGRTPDTLEGRLEITILNASLAFIRLRQEGDLAPLAQTFADKLFRSFDAGLREAGVGDLAVPKRMRRIAADFYGRLDAYAAPLAAGDRLALEKAISRNVLDGRDLPFAGALASYAMETAARQADADVATMLRLDGWAPAPA